MTNVEVAGEYGLLDAVRDRDDRHAVPAMRTCVRWPRWMATAFARMKYETTSLRADRTFELRTVSVNLGSAITARMP